MQLTKTLLRENLHGVKGVLYIQILTPIIHPPPPHLLPLRTFLPYLLYSTWRFDPTPLPAVSRPNTTPPPLPSPDPRPHHASMSRPDIGRLCLIYTNFDWLYVPLHIPLYYFISDHVCFGSLQCIAQSRLKHVSLHSLCNVTTMHVHRGGANNTNTLSWGAHGKKICLFHFFPWQRLQTFSLNFRRAVEHTELSYTHSYMISIRTLLVVKF